MDDFEILGWIKVGPKSYRHHCGARVANRGRLWTATSITGATLAGHSTALQAMLYLQENDPSFWSYGHSATVGSTRGVWLTVGCLNADPRERREGAFVCYLDSGDSLPAFLKPVFKKHLFGRSHCQRCVRPMTLLETRALREFDQSGGTENLYFVCNCGYPVWSLDRRSVFDFMRAIGPAETKWRREERIRAAGGHHTPGEIHQLLVLQDNRCIYCDRQFTTEIRATEDHLLAVADGGTNWALNIVMACWRCNCRRSDIPFRTFCKLLSQRQNRRILTHLAKRIRAMDLVNLPDEAVASFDEGLAHHDAKHPRFVNMRLRNVISRRNTDRNELLPCTRRLILKKALHNRVVDPVDDIATFPDFDKTPEHETYR